ncbi:hypothetical protein BM477_07275 [Boudabousia marimammalium]|uniref:Fibronectin type-III domain-containing protein n=2 Tax=Boudabousia marimammalium TaxID=156892 RepID=A0A1Q5PJW6_9ACTO|nr:hypothetical protein BM477_07275 [Boudabousia marimammalium]
MTAATGLALAPVATALAEPACAAPNEETGWRTSLDYTAGKAEGSGKWGLIGDVKTRNSRPTYISRNGDVTDNNSADVRPCGEGAVGCRDVTYNYGVGVNPVTGDLWVSDSGKVCHGRFACSAAGLGFLNQGQAGTPRVFQYAPTGTDQEDATDYKGNGKYNVQPADRNYGIGKQFVELANRTVHQNEYVSAQIPNLVHGPRGITFTKDGTTWVVDSESRQPNNATNPNRIKRYAPDGTIIAGAGVAGTWVTGSTTPGNFNSGYSVSLTTRPDGSVLANAEVDDTLVVFAPDGTPLPKIKLDNPTMTGGLTHPFAPHANGNRYINPYGVASDPEDGSLYLSLVNFRDDDKNTMAPFIEKRAADGTTVTQFVGEGRFNEGDVTFGPFVNDVAGSPTYRHMFAWSQSQSAIQEFDKDGNFIREWINGSTADANEQETSKTVATPNMAIPRGIDFDKNGFMYVTIGEGTDNARVQVYGMTPNPIDQASAKYVDSNYQSATVTWVDAPDTPGAADSKSDVLDYSIELSEDNGATWNLIERDRSIVKSYTLENLDPAKDYLVRIAAWNEAGNGDWRIAPLRKARIELTKQGAFDANANQINWTFAITNTGKCPLTNVEITDTLTGISGITYDWANVATQGTLAPNESINASTTSAIEMQNQSQTVVNTAAVTAAAGNLEVADTAEATVIIPTVKPTPDTTPEATAEGTTEETPEVAPGGQLPKTGSTSLTATLYTVFAGITIGTGLILFRRRNAS